MSLVANQLVPSSGGLSLPFVDLNSRDYAEIKVVGSALGITTKVTVGKCSLSRLEVLPESIADLPFKEPAYFRTPKESTPVALIPASVPLAHGLCMHNPPLINSDEMKECDDCEAFADCEKNKLECEFPLPSGKEKFTYTFPSGMVDAEYHASQNQLAEMKNIGNLGRLWKKIMSIASAAFGSVDQSENAIEQKRARLNVLAKKICKALRSVFDWEKVNEISHRQRDQVVRDAETELKSLKETEDKEVQLIKDIRLKSNIHKRYPHN